MTHPAAALWSVPGASAPSIYVEDPWQNPLCFVEEGTVYTG